MVVTKTGMITPGTAQYDNVNLTNINGSPYSGGGGLSYTVLTVTSGDLAPGATYDEAVDFGFTSDRFIVDYAILTLNAGTSTMVKVAFYDGDPGAGGTFMCPMYGGDFVSINFTGSPTMEGMYQAYGGAIGVTAPVSGKSTNLYVRITNADFSNNGTYEVSFWGREITGTP